MESFSLINNPLIASIDTSAKTEITLDNNLKNTLKTLVKINPSVFYNSNEIYNKSFSFDIPRTYNELSQLYIKCFLSTNEEVAVVSTTFFSTKIFKKIVIRTKQGITLQTINPTYTYQRACALYGSSNWSFIENNMQPSSLDFSDSEVYCVVPLFFFFSESVNSFLQTRMLESLELYCETNNDFTSMGMDIALTSARYELFACYHDTDTSSAIFDKSYTTKFGLFKTLKHTFDIFEEQNVVVATGSTSARLLLRCNYPIFAMHIELRANNSDIAVVKTVELEIKGNKFLTFDRDINYEFSTNTEGLYDSGLTLWFSKLKSRIIDSGFIIFSGSMFPSYLNLTFDALPSDYTLTVLCEYRTQFDVDSTGKIQLNNSFSSLDQNNSEKIGNIQR